MAVAQESDAINVIDKMVTGWIKDKIESRWGEFGTAGRNLRFTSGALARMSQVLGFIHGLRLSGKTEAVQLAHALAGNLLRAVDMLSHYGDWIDTKQKVPTFIVLLHDDGTFMSWSFVAYQAVNVTALTEEERSRLLEKAFKHEGKPLILPHLSVNSDRYAYVHSFNGGLIYDGPGAGETFTVNIGTHTFWTMHT